MEVDAIVESLWEQTGNAIAKEKGGWIVFNGCYWPIDFNGNLSVVITVDNEKEANVASWFWRPDACNETLPLLLHWLKEKQMAIDQLNEQLSENLLQFRADYKERLWQMARKEISNSAAVIGKKEAIVEVKRKKHPLKSKTVWTGAATAGTGTIAMFIHLDPRIYSMLMMFYGFLVVIWRFVTNEPIR